MLLVKCIKTEKGPDGTHSFVAEMDVNGRPLQLPVTAREVLNYSAFQDAVLSATGQVYCAMACEGRSPEMADYFWRQITGATLDVLPDPEPTSKAKVATTRTPTSVN